MTGGPGQSGSPLCALGAADYDSAIVDEFFFNLNSGLFAVLGTETEAERGEG